MLPAAVCTRGILNQYSVPRGPFTWLTRPCKGLHALAWTGREGMVQPEPPGEGGRGAHMSHLPSHAPRERARCSQLPHAGLCFTEVSGRLDCRLRLPAEGPTLGNTG